MKEILKEYVSYEDIVDSFEFDEIIVFLEDNDYQGDSFYLVKKNNEYGLLIFGWGSCSGCDELAGINYSYNKTEELKVFQNQLWNSITWRNLNDMIDYVENKDFSLEWYGSSYGVGRKFVAEVKKYFSIESF